MWCWSKTSFIWCYSLIFICHGRTPHGYLWELPGQAADKISTWVMQRALSGKRLFPCINVTQRLYPAKAVIHHGANPKHLVVHVRANAAEFPTPVNTLLNQLFKRKPGQLLLKQRSDLSALGPNLLWWQPTLPRGQRRIHIDSDWDLKDVLIVWKVTNRSIIIRAETWGDAHRGGGGAQKCRWMRCAYCSCMWGSV